MQHSLPASVNSATTSSAERLRSYSRKSARLISTFCLFENGACGLHKDSCELETASQEHCGRRLHLLASDIVAFSEHPRHWSLSRANTNEATRLEDLNFSRCHRHHERHKSPLVIHRTPKVGSYGLIEHDIRRPEIRWILLTRRVVSYACVRTVSGQYMYRISPTHDLARTKRNPSVLIQGVPNGISTLVGVATARRLSEDQAENAQEKQY